VAVVLRKPFIGGGILPAVKGQCKARMGRRGRSVVRGGAARAASGGAFGVPLQRVAPRADAREGRE